ncbi:hypothetical protein ACHAWF_016619 [Thalassiosira exigua]
MAAADGSSSQREQRRAYTEGLEQEVLSLSAQLAHMRDNAGEEVSPEYVDASEEKLAALQEELRERKQGEFDEFLAIGRGHYCDDGEGSALAAKSGGGGDERGRSDNNDRDIVDDDEDSIFAMARRIDRSKVLDDPSCIQGAVDDEYWKKERVRRGNRVARGGRGKAPASKARSSTVPKQQAPKVNRVHAADKVQHGEVGGGRCGRSSEDDHGKKQRGHRPSTTTRSRRHNAMRGSGRAIRLNEKANDNQTGCDKKSGSAQKQCKGSSGRKNSHIKTRPRP